MAGVALGVAGCVLAISLFRGGVIGTHAFYAPVVQVDLPLTPEDDYAAVVRVLGRPAVECTEQQYELLGYPQRKLYIILMDADRTAPALRRRDGLELAPGARGGSSRPWSPLSRRRRRLPK